MARRKLVGSMINTDLYKANTDIDTTKALDSRLNKIDTGRIDLTNRTPALAGNGSSVPTGKTSASTGANNRNKVFNAFGEIAPYISNIANAFRSAPRPALPNTLQPVYANRVNYSNQRNEIARSVRGANANADMTLDENTSAAVKANNFVGGLRVGNAVNEAESNANAQIMNRNAEVNAGIDAQNTGIMNNYKQQNVEAAIADSREQSQNLANAGDKFVAQQNVRGQQDLDRRKLGVYSTLFANSGVMGRVNDNYQKYLQDNGLPSDSVVPIKFSNGGSMGRKKLTDNGRVIKYGDGGPMTKGLLPKPTYNFPAGVQPTAEDSSVYRNAFDGVANRDVSSMKMYNVLKQGIPSTVTEEAYKLALIHRNAYDDAAGENLMNDMDVHNELIKPLFKPKDIVRRKIK